MTTADLIQLTGARPKPPQVAPAAGKIPSLNQKQQVPLETQRGTQVALMPTSDPLKFKLQ
jgi:hypothetical protein